MDRAILANGGGSSKRLPIADPRSARDRDAHETIRVGDPAPNRVKRCLKVLLELVNVEP